MAQLSPYMRGLIEAAKELAIRESYAQKNLETLTEYVSSGKAPESHYRKYMSALDKLTTQSTKLISNIKKMDAQYMKLGNSIDKYRGHSGVLYK